MSTLGCNGLKFNFTDEVYISNSAVCVNIESEILERPVKVANGQAAGAVGAAMLA